MVPEGALVVVAPKPPNPEPNPVKPVADAVVFAPKPENKELLVVVVVVPPKLKGVTAAVLPKPLINLSIK